jgi:hypothetical protein
MDLNCALELLELKTPYTKKELRKQYLKKALIHHPDKNCHENTNSQFTEIKDAYTFLENYLIHDDIDEDMPPETDNYLFIIEKFIKMITIVDFNSVKEIMQLLYQNCQHISISTFERIDKSNALRIFAYMNQYSDLLGIDEDILQQFREIIKEKIESDEFVIINPSLDNLLESEIYILNHCEETYYIPLWHDEVTYDSGENTLIVKCIPQLPSHIYIDECNNIHFNLKTSVQKALLNKKITFNIGKKVFEIETNELKIIKQQTHIIKNKGISSININDTYDANKKCNIIINVELY